MRILSELGAYSVEAWPSAVAPWVLVPLAGLPAGASLRRPIAWSALAVASAGGVNGTAVFAILPLTGLWLLSLESTRRRLLAVSGWCLAVVLATTWWIGPLLLLGGYSPPFLDFIETSAVTTQVTDLQTSIRGASQWLAYLRDNFGPLWPVGHRLATEPLLIAASVCVAAAGLAGLARRGMPHRRFLITVLLIGVAMVGFGHVAAVDGAFAQWQRSLLDGVAAPLRNVHKFDVLIRLPLGIAHLAGIFMAAAAHTPGSDRARLRMLAVTGAWFGVDGLTITPLVDRNVGSRDFAAEWRDRPIRQGWMFGCVLVTACALLLAWRRRAELALYVLLGAARTVVALVQTIELWFVIFVGGLLGIVWGVSAASVSGQVSNPALTHGLRVGVLCLCSALALVPLASLWLVRADLVPMLKERAG